MKNAGNGTPSISITEILRNSRELGRKLCKKFPCLINSHPSTRCIICSKTIKETLRDEQLLCQGCVDSPPRFKSLCSITPYSPRTAEIIQKLKYRGCSRIARCLGAQLAIHVASTSPYLLEKMPVIVPVPQTFKKTFKRGYNQAALLGKVFSRLTCTPFLPTGLKRVHEVSSLSGKPAEQRRRVIEGAFTINTLKGSRWNNIILLDDVATTLSTLNECTAAIQGCLEGPKGIWAVTIARSI